MVQLKNLHLGDIVYQVCEYHWCMKLKIVGAFNIKNGMKAKIIAPGELDDGSWVHLCEDDEEALFFFKQEAKNYQRLCRKKNSNRLKDIPTLLHNLYDMAESSMTNADREMYHKAVERAVNVCK